ncbi:MAG: GNAT family N-acetyltransferase [Clostridia bacterium]|nr:GNAT family N-acetyltransferase [Clostridia bacterium]
MNDTIECLAGNPSLRQAFRDYFAELGVTVRDWDSLFDEIDRSGRKFLVRRDEQAQITGFLLFLQREMTCGFYTTDVGCIEELYVVPARRQRGHGQSLLAAAETRFRADGCGYMLLTSDDAGAFYARCGYHPAPRIRAKNGDPVFVKPLG